MTYIENKQNLSNLLQQWSTTNLHAYICPQIPYEKPQLPTSIWMSHSAFAKDRTQWYIDSASNLE